MKKLINNRSPRHQRVWELDALRGIAIILMVVFHTVFDLRVFFGIRQINYHEGFWYYEGRVAAVIFIVLVGVVTSLIAQQGDVTKALQKNSYRGIRLLGLGTVITLITLVLTPQNTIWFGILHFLGLAVLIGIPFCHYKWINIIFASLLFVGYYPINNFYTVSYLGIIFGILPDSFSSFDHYSLIPWLGYVLIGIALGNWIYPKGQPLIKRTPTRVEAGLARAGKYSLWIYFIHQPILLGVIWLFFRFL